MFGRDVRRTDDDASREAVQFGERDRGRELISSRDQNRSIRQLREAAAEAGAAPQIVEAHGGRAAQEEAPGQVRRTT